MSTHMPRQLRDRWIRLAAILCALCCVGAIAAQNTIVVSGGGDALQQAIDAAAPGDRLEVRAARYHGCRIAKGLTIDCDAGVVLDGGPQTAVEIADLPRAEVVEFRGGEVLVTDAFPRGEPSLVLHDCAGVVVVEGTRLVIRRPGVYLTGEQVRVRACAGAVCFVDFGIRGALGPEEYLLATEDCASIAFVDSAELLPIHAVRSDLELAGVTIRAVIRTPSLRVDDSNLSITDSTIEGSAGSISAPNLFPAVRIRGGDLTLAGDTLLTGGSLYGVPGPALSAWNGTVRIGERVEIRSDATTAIVGDAPVVEVPVPSVRASLHAQTGRIDVRVAARPNDLVATVVEVQGTPSSTPFGPLWVVLTAPVVDSGSVPGSGFRSFSLAGPTLARPVPVVFQPIVLTPDDELVLGTAHPLVLR